MKQFTFILFLIVLVFTSCIGQRSGQQQILLQEPAVELNFTFTRLSGFSSNQFAAWIEDINGHYVKTLYATRWTADGGWSRRPLSLPVWVRQSNLANMSKEQIDSISGATPRGTVTLNYFWDGTNSQGDTVPYGNYILFLEGTLRGENQVLYQAPITFGQGVLSAVVGYEYTGDSITERSMISDVSVKILR